MNGAPPANFRDECRHRTTWIFRSNFFWTHGKASLGAGSTRVLASNDAAAATHRVSVAICREHGVAAAERETLQAGIRRQAG